MLLSDEQPTAMRTMVSEGSLFEDRFDSMRARNLIDSDTIDARRGRRILVLFTFLASLCRSTMPHTLG